MAVAPGDAAVLSRRAAQRARCDPERGARSAGARALHRAPAARWPGGRARLRAPARGARAKVHAWIAVTRLVPTAEMTLGPFFPREFARGANDLTVWEGKRVAGEAIEVTGRIVASDGLP